MAHEHKHNCECEHHEHHHEHNHEHHHHDHDHSIRESLVKIIASALLLGAAVLVEHLFQLPTWALLIVYLIPYLIVGGETLHEAAENTLHGRLFDEAFLMTIATLGALCIGFLPGAENQFPEAVFVMLFFQVGELFETIAEGRSRRSISQLMDIRPDTAHVLRQGEEITLKPDQVQIGETILVKPGERIPMDGTVLQGQSTLDTVALTGESVPRSVHPGDQVISGCVNLSGLLHVRVDQVADQSTAAKVLQLVENATEHKSKQENFITRFARIYTPIVVFAALALAFIPPLFSPTYLQALPIWLYRALTFLVVSCPCALVISVPLTFFSGIGRASKQGILIKGSNYLEALSRLQTVVFDKTGTLTKGTFQVTVVHPQTLTENQLLHLAAHVERHSNHPIAQSLRAAYPNEHDDCQVQLQEEISGHGILAQVNGKTVAVGNHKLMQKLNITHPDCHHAEHGTNLHVAIDGQYAGHIIISDQVKDDAHTAINDLRAAGIHTVMLTGDHHDVAQHVAQQLQIDEFHADLLPQNKVEQVEQLLNPHSSILCQRLEPQASHPHSSFLNPPSSSLAFVGDGINDAPVLARADIGIAMGALGSDAAIEAADVVLMDDKPSKIALAMQIARRTLRIAQENIWFAIGIKLAVLLLASLGMADMWMAVFADVGVTVLAVLNAMRA